MKATTTVTTSSYFGNVDNKYQRQQNKQSQQHNITNFIPPNEMLKRLIPYSNVQKQKQTQLRTLITKQQQQSFTLPSPNNNLSKAQLVNDIQLLQGQLNNIHAEIIQSQNLLNVRDSLYGQLDMLREQRQLIEGDVAYLQAYNASKQVNINIKPNNQGYREMNQRLRRRMSQIREYIHKMQLENNKIDQSLNYNTVLNIEKSYYRTQQQQMNNMTMNNNNAWVSNSYYGQQQREKTIGRVDQLITRLHIKQQQALQNVRRQQEEINRRNNFNRASFMPNNTAVGFHQSRTYYPPTETIGRGRFYSPEYRY